MEMPHRSSGLESIVYAQQNNEDDSKFIEQYLQQRLPSSHLDITNSSYLRNLGYPTSSGVASFLNGVARQQPIGLSLLHDQHYQSTWPQALNQLAWGRQGEGALRDPSLNLPSSYPPPPATASVSNGTGSKRPQTDSRLQMESRNRDDDEDSPSPTEGTDAPPSNKRKAMSLQEKNRRAQKRFREKQKVKMSTLEQQNDVMSLQLNQLRSDNDTLRNRNGVLEKVLKLRDEQIAVLQEKVKLFEAKEEHGKSKQSMSEASAAVEPMQMLPADEGPYSADQVSNMSADDVITAWKEYLKELSTWVVKAETPTPSPEVVQRVEDIISEAGTMCTRVAILNPMCIKKLVSCNLENPDAGGAEPKHWKDVLNALAMTPEQKLDAIAARQVFLSKLKAVTDERQVIHAKLQNAVPREQEGNNQTTGASLQAHDALAQLKENLRREHNIHWEFNAGLFGKVMSKLQVAKAAVHSYPFYPDALGIANVIAEELGKGADPAVDVP